MKHPPRDRFHPTAPMITSWGQVYILHYGQLAAGYGAQDYEGLGAGGDGSR